MAEIKLHALCKSNSVRMIVNGELSKTLVRALPYETVWVDEPSPFVVSRYRVANFLPQCFPSNKLRACANKLRAWTALY